VHVVWELTLACDLHCLHCGSRAGRRRPNELNTEECLDVVDQLAALGTREVSLIGGEAYLRRDLAEIIARIKGHGMYCGIQTGGRNFTDKRLDAVVEAGLDGLGVSLDGLAGLHDELRGAVGSFDAAVSTLRRAQARGLNTSVNTQVGARTMTDLMGILDCLIEIGVTHWQVQLTVAMGNAADNPENLLQPYELGELMPLLLRAYQICAAHGIVLEPGNNIGYFGPYEHIWRQPTSGLPHWSGCEAGETSIGLEADGTIKGCPSLATARYAGGNIREASVREAWLESTTIQSVRARPDELWGFCADCYYADVCSAGCTWTVDSLFGQPGNNPYCHHRVLELAEHGLRERIVQKESAASTPFGTGRFELIVENLDQSTRQNTAAPRGRDSMSFDAHTGFSVPSPKRRSSSRPPLTLCGRCLRFIFSDELACPFCGTDVELGREEHESERATRLAALDQVQVLLDEHGLGTLA
jgi:Y-X(10)_GDL-associated radical SAM protein